MFELTVTIEELNELWERGWIEVDGVRCNYVGTQTPAHEIDTTEEIVVIVECEN